MKVAVIGATGLVGKQIIQLLASRNFPVSELILAASDKSTGKSIRFQNTDQVVVSIDEALSMKPQLAIFSAGAEVSLEYAPKFADMHCRVIDNSSAWRMDVQKKLIVPEVNADVLQESDYIIANPNCSTIQMVLPLQVFEKCYGLSKVIVSTYQSVSGSGQSGLDQLLSERAGDNKTDKFYPHTIDLNLIPQIDAFCDNGFTKEEMKMIEETQKIMRLPDLHVNATAVRVPVLYGHSESVYIELNNTPPSVEEVYQNLFDFPGIKVYTNSYPMPMVQSGDDLVHIGRLRRDLSNPNAFSFWIVADNIRKGAATNALQIAEYLVEKNWIK